MCTDRQTDRQPFRIKCESQNGFSKSILHKEIWEIRSVLKIAKSSQYEKQNTSQGSLRVYLR